MTGQVNVVALVRGEERYVFLFDDASHDAALEQFARYAADGELSFDWQDAALLGREVREGLPDSLPDEMDEAIVPEPIAARL